MWLFLSIFCHLPVVSFDSTRERFTRHLAIKLIPGKVQSSTSVDPNPTKRSIICGIQFSFVGDCVAVGFLDLFWHHDFLPCFAKACCCRMLLVGLSLLAVGPPAVLLAPPGSSSTPPFTPQRSYSSTRILPRGSTEHHLVGYWPRIAVRSPHGSIERLRNSAFRRPGSTPMKVRNNGGAKVLAGCPAPENMYLLISDRASLSYI
jgi:hypothetical protein